MELKKYQKLVLEDLSSYIIHVDADSDLNKAWNNYWEGKNIPVGLGGVPTYKNTILGVPHICMKVPTGGGKTFMAACSLKRIFDNMPGSKEKVVIWLVPSDSILMQTIRAFNTVDHPYRQQLDKDFGGRVNVFTKDQLLNAQGFSPDSLEGTLNVCILSYASLRINSRKADVRKVYQENGNLLKFANYFNNREILLADTPDTALIQVLRQLNPVVIVDESHNAESDLSVEMLERLNPAFILDLTATPKDNSNIISYVDARELKKDHMVKLPVVVFNRKSVGDVLQDAIILRNTIEGQAKSVERAGGRYIRPILLLQAQPNRNESSETYTKIKDKLIALGVPKDQIAIKTGDKDEIGNTDLLSKSCGIRYIITVNALKEGWDCPFAYILASVANRSSKVEVEQILGRILRQPYAEQHAESLLNTSYVLTSSTDFNETLNEIVKGLNKAGFSDKDYRVGTTEVVTQPANTVSPELQSTGYEPVDPQVGIVELHDAVSENSTNDLDGINVEQIRSGIQQAIAEQESGTAIPAGPVAEMIQQATTQAEAYTEEFTQSQNSGLIGGELGSMLNQCTINAQYAQSVESLRIPQFYRHIGAPITFLASMENVLLEKEHLNDGFSLAAQDANIAFDFSASEVATVDIELSAQNDAVPRYKILNRAESVYFNDYVSHLPTEQRVSKCAEYIAAQLNRNNRFRTSDITSYVRRIIDGMNSEDLASMEGNIVGYSRKIREKINALEESYRETRFFEWLDNAKINVQYDYVLPSVIAPMSASSSISKGLYSKEADDLNNFEKKVINYIAGLNNIKWWHRIIERGENEFKINGFINHYPDFMVMTNNGKLILVETKGDHLDGIDSSRKLKLGRAWQNQAGSNFRYFMVYESINPGWEGAYSLDAFVNIITNL